MTLMQADLAAWPNTLTSAPCSDCNRQVDINPVELESIEAFYEAEDGLRARATSRCGCSVGDTGGGE